MGSAPARERPVVATAKWKVRQLCSAAAMSLGRSLEARVSGTTQASRHGGTALLRAAKHSSFRTMR
jgi:hypothetical protein